MGMSDSTHAAGALTVRLMLLSAVRPPLPLLLQILVPLIAAQPTIVTSTCLSPVRPFFGAHGKWTEAAPGALDLYYHSVVNYEPDTCGMLERVRNRHGRKPAKYLHSNTRFDAERTSRLVWSDASGVPHRPLDGPGFLHRFRGSDVVIVGDSHSGIVHQSLTILLGCSQPQREWPEVEGLQSHVVVGAHGNGTKRDYGVLSLKVPEYDFRLFRIPTNILTPVVEKRRSAAAPSFYIQDGQRIRMRPQETDKIVRLDAPGLGAWADARHFRRAGLVLMKQGAWANNYRSDVKVFNMQGKMVRPTDGEAAFKEMYETGVVRAIDWFDQVLPPTAVVIWMAGGASVVGKNCSAVRKDTPCRGSGLSRDRVLIEALTTRRKRWAGCGADLEKCARSRPRQWLLDISAPQVCRPDLQMGCNGRFENTTVKDWHPAIPGLPDLWNAMAFESVLEDDVRCAARTQLTPAASSGAYLASLDREERGRAGTSLGTSILSAVAEMFRG